MTTARIITSIVPLLTWISLSCVSAHAGDSKADALVKKSDQFRSPQESFSVTVNVADSQGGEKKQSTFRVYSKGNQLTLVDQKAPARQVGRKLLMREHDLWLFTPSTSRPTRISFEQKLTGEVSNGDLMRTNFSEDYDATWVSEEAVGDVPAIKLHLVAKTKEVTYRSIDYWIAKSNNHPLKATFFALSGKPLKSALYSEFKPQLGHPRLTKVVITDALQKNHTSVLNYFSFKKEDLDDAFFSKESLAQ